MPTGQTAAAFQARLIADKARENVSRRSIDSSAVRRDVKINVSAFFRVIIGAVSPGVRIPFVD